MRSKNVELPQEEISDEAFKKMVHGLDLSMPPVYDSNTERALKNSTSVAEAVGILHPEFAAAAKKHGVDLTKTPNRDFETMRKYFREGTGTYVAIVDYQTAKVMTQKVNAEAQIRITKVLGKPRNFLVKFFLYMFLKYQRI